LLRLLNHLEDLSSQNLELKADKILCPDEIAMLKGHQGKPDIKPNAKNPTSAAEKLKKPVRSEKRKKLSKVSPVANFFLLTEKKLLNCLGLTCR
jgi:hypothetical protein